MNNILIVGLILMIWIGARGIYRSYQGLLELRKAEETMRALRELLYGEREED
jgi:hypothetical protein